MILLAVVAFVLTAATSWTMAKSNGNPSQTAQRSNADAAPTVLAQNLKWSKAILTVSNMSCGGCIDTIKKSVAALPGTGNVNRVNSFYNVSKPKSQFACLMKPLNFKKSIGPVTP